MILGLARSKIALAAVSKMVLCANIYSEPVQMAKARNFSQECGFSGILQVFALNPTVSLIVVILS